MKGKFDEGKKRGMKTMEEKYFITIELNSKESADWLKKQIEDANPVIKGFIRIIEEKVEPLNKIIERIK